MNKRNRVVSLLLALFMLLGVVGTVPIMKIRAEEAAEEAEPDEMEAEEPAEGESEEAEAEGEAEEPAEEPSEEEPSEEEPAEEPAEEETEEPAAGEQTTADGSKPLLVAMDPASGRFSPYYAETATDRDISDMTQIGLLTNDRAGDIVFNGIDGETKEYNGTEYTYYSPANLEIEINEDTDETIYHWTIRDDLKFSDGTPLTIDDVIFTFYAFSDPDYTGASTFYSLPVKGMKEYRTQTSTEIYTKYETLWNSIVEAGPDNVPTEEQGWTQEQQDFVWKTLHDATVDGLQKVVDYVDSNYLDAYAEAILGVPADEVRADETLRTALGMALWGFGDVVTDDAQEEPTEDAEEPAETEEEAATEEAEAEAEEAEAEEPAEEEAAEEEPAEEEAAPATGLTYSTEDETWTWKFAEGGPTIEDFATVALATYDNDYANLFATETVDAGGESYEAVRENYISTMGAQDEDQAEGGVPNIEGIVRLSDTQLDITLKGFDAAAVYRQAMQITPMHIYGDAEAYDYENNNFGVTFGDQSHIRAQNDHPVGAGPYIFEEYKDKVAYYEANPNYYLGEPKIKYFQYVETDDKDKVAAVASGRVDIASPSFSKTASDEIASYNSNGEITGDTLMAINYDTLGYGYIGLNAETMKVGDDSGSEASKNLRRAFATILAQQRELAVNSYYGEAASVIQYPISNTSWAAPRPADEGYRIAYSTDVDGNDIYTSDMSEDEMADAAVEAAKGFLIAAGYTFDEASGKFTAAPEGAKLEYEVIVPAEGTGNHPSFSLVNAARELFDRIGITLKINDPANPQILWDSLEAGTAELWCAAWSATIDPDMYQVYHSDNIEGRGGTGSNHYRIADDQLDNLIMEARTSADQTFRKATYFAALERILDWAVEVPVYQRQECTLVSVERVNVDTLPGDLTTFYGWSAEIQNLEMN